MIKNYTVWLEFIYLWNFSKYLKKLQFIQRENINYTFCCLILMYKRGNECTLFQKILIPQWFTTLSIFITTRKPCEIMVFLESSFGLDVTLPRVFSNGRIFPLKFRQFHLKIAQRWSQSSVNDENVYTRLVMTCKN